MKKAGFIFNETKHLPATKKCILRKTCAIEYFASFPGLLLIDFFVSIFHVTKLAKMEDLKVVVKKECIGVPDKIFGKTCESIGYC